MVPQSLDDAVVRGTPQQHRTKLLELAKKRNTVNLGTGRGKILVALLPIKQMVRRTTCRSIAPDARSRRRSWCPPRHSHTAHHHPPRQPSPTLSRLRSMRAPTPIRRGNRSRPRTSSWPPLAPPRIPSNPAGTSDIHRARRPSNRPLRARDRRCRTFSDTAPCIFKVTCGIPGEEHVHAVLDKQILDLVPRGDGNRGVCRHVRRIIEEPMRLHDEE